MTPPVPERFALFLDFDGTLVDIVDRPDGVKVAAGLQDTIEKVVERAGGAVAVVTGRKVSDVDALPRHAHRRCRNARAGAPRQARAPRSNTPRRRRRSRRCASASSRGAG